MRSFKIGLIQFASEVGNRPANMEKAEGFVRRCAAHGAQLVLLPELWDLGYLAGDLYPQLAEPLRGKVNRRIAAWAKELAVWLCNGSLAEKTGDGRIYNMSLLFDDQGRVVMKHRKVHVYSNYEKRWFSPGGSFKTVQMGDVVLSTMICYDGDFPEVPRLLTLKGAQMLLHPSAYPKPYEWDWRNFCEVHARQNGVFIASTNHVGAEPGERASAFYPQGRLS